MKYLIYLNNLFTHKVGEWIRHSKNSELAVHGNDATNLIEQGFEVLWQGGAKNVSAAHDLFMSALRVDPWSSSAHAGMARIMRFRKNLELALEHAEIAESKNLSDYHNLKIKAYILRDLGRLEDAIHALNRAAALEPVGQDRFLTELTAKIIASAQENQHCTGLKIILNSLHNFAPDSWEPYRLGWWLLKEKGDKTGSQLMAVGRFVSGVGRKFFEESFQTLTISDLKEYGIIIEEKILDLDEVSRCSLNKKNTHYNKKKCNVRIVALKQTCCISTRFATAILVDGKLVEELSQNDALLVQYRTLPEPQEVRGRVLNVAFPWGEGFFHFMMEILPTIGLAQEVFGKSAFDKYFLRTRVPYQLKIFAQLGINENQLIFSDQTPSILANELVTISNLVPVPPLYEVPSWSCHYVRKRLSHMGLAINECSERVFINRGKGVNGRTVINEAQVESLLKKYGFETIYPETLDFSNQVSLYQNADYIVATAGSALLNIVFCKPGTKILVLYQPNNIWQVYQSIAKAMDLEIHSLFGELSPVSAEIDPDWMDIDDNVNYLVNESKLEDALNVFFKLKLLN